MNRIVYFFTILFITVNVNAQDKDEVLAEAWLMYNSEKASWNGTDMVTQYYPEKLKTSGGYFSYTNDDRHTCVFFNRDSVPSITISISFDDTFIPETTKVDTTYRKMTSLENDLYEIRQKAIIESVNDTVTFKRYKNTNYNYIPLIVGKKKKVYILTGTGVRGVVVFGNDYLITFDKKNRIKKKKPLHKNIIPIEYSDNPDENITIHNHQEETGDLITATDICTLMLYCPYTNWSQHYVVSKKNISIWDCEKSELFVVTMKAWKRMNEHDLDKEREENK
ncbi:hypothetical protein DVK85_13425 [Flavobacterium arcticum]|uniref:Uncharacterized protein n=1 Tax=Flavobacterium arcticum TaxID=1784713 RepID=A0A345HF14_9FLAO|nr:hypothetical protein [Flavobacterium arcticum]AXG75174.1 hypothetical protein DVK85_13425 [Flavobacterium arcticum]KAF2511045.1 hypothetical protein E0W72_06525 [Flavobacterium arcticum]